MGFLHIAFNRRNSHCSLRNCAASKPYTWPDAEQFVLFAASHRKFVVHVQERRCRDAVIVPFARLERLPESTTASCSSAQSWKSTITSYSQKDTRSHVSPFSMRLYILAGVDRFTNAWTRRTRLRILLRRDKPHLKRSRHQSSNCLADRPQSLQRSVFIPLIEMRCHIR